MDTDDQEKKPAKKPDEKGDILVDEHIKIYDPNSGEVFLDKRETN
jgi:hypothetical protein